MLYLIGICVGGIIWGFATNAVIKNKGYNDNWFWWGFFFGFIAFLVALAKSENRTKTVEGDSAAYIEPIVKTEETWKCIKCSRYNTGVICQCGMFKGDSENHRKTQEAAQRKIAEERLVAEKQEQMNTETKMKAKNELEIATILLKYKELLDAGALTQEEFDTKKTELLGKN